MLSLALFSCAVMKAQQKYLLENEHMLAKIDLKQGALSGFKNKETGWEIIGNGKNCSFEAKIRFPDRSLHIIDAFSQGRPQITTAENALTLVWNNFEVAGKRLEIAFTGTIAMTAEGLVYGGKIVNNSDCTVEQLAWPFLRDVTIPADTRKMLFQYMTYSKFNTVELYPKEPGKG